MLITVGPDEGLARSVFVNARLRTVSDLSDRTYPILTTDGSDEFLTRDNDRDTLRNPHGREQCVFDDRPANAAGSMSPDGMAVILGNQVVFGTHDSLMTFNEGTCVKTGSIPTSTRTAALMAAPGVTLVVRTDDTGTWVDGYA